MHVSCLHEKASRTYVDLSKFSSSHAKHTCAGICEQSVTRTEYVILHEMNSPSVMLTRHIHALTTLTTNLRVILQKF